MIKELYVLFGLIAIIIFIYDNLSFKFLSKIYLDLTEKKSVYFLIIFYTCLGFLITIYNPLPDNVITLSIILIIIPLFSWVFIFKKHFKFFSPRYLYFWDRTFKGDDTVFEYVDTFNKLPKSILKKIQIKISESVPVIVLAVTILMFIPIGMILSLNSAFFLTLFFYPFIKKLFLKKVKKREEFKKEFFKRTHYDKVSVNFIEQFFTHKGLIGMINFLFAYIFIGFNLTFQLFLYALFIIEENIYDSFLFLLINFYIPTLLFILLYTHKLSKRYKFFIDVWYKRNVDENSETTGISRLDDFGLFIAFLIIISSSVIFEFYDFNRNSEKFIFLEIFSIIIWSVYLLLIIKSLKKTSNEIENNNLIKDNLRLPIVGTLSIVTFASYNNFDIFLISIPLLFVFGFFILDWYVYLKNKNIRYDKRILLLLIPVIFLLLILFLTSPYYLINIVCIIGIVMVIFFIIIECLSFRLYQRKN